MDLFARPLVILALTIATAGCRSLPPAPAVKVLVIDALCEAPLPGVDVRAERGTEAFATTTDPQGIAALRLPPGRWSVTATLPGLPPASLSLDVTSSSTIMPRLVVETRKPGSMTVEPHGPCRRGD